MPVQRLTFDLPSVDATTRFATTLGASLAGGDVVLLAGEVGAGKTHFARALIQSLLEHPEDVPSPTFTLVQTYDSTLGDIWHADLYRLTSMQEIEELGLTEAFENAISLVEWPDRLGQLTPPHALTLTLTEGSDEGSRVLRAGWNDPKWAAKLAEWQP